MNCNTDEYYRSCEDLSLLVNELDAAKLGIDNLKFTYSNDANIASQLDILIIKIQTVLKDTKYKLQYYQSLLPAIHQKPKDTGPTSMAFSPGVPEEIGIDVYDNEYEALV
jgi:hypothetical protein